VRSSGDGTAQSTAAAISAAVVRLFREYMGRGPTKARTTIDRDTVTVVLRDMLTRGERKLIDDGETETVLALRTKLQKTMRDDLVSAVEMLTERKVIAFTSGNDLEADVAAEVFLLQTPAAADDLAASE
jgi:uncharacterized protein YbcI